MRAIVNPIRPGAMLLLVAAWALASCAPAEKDGLPVDRFGDALPEGAVAR